jgi:ankyrin repeat protein
MGNSPTLTSGPAAMHQSVAQRLGDEPDETLQPEPIAALAVAQTRLPPKPVGTLHPNKCTSAMDSMNCRPRRVEGGPMNEFGEPNMGNPSVRFDEGRESAGHWLINAPMAAAGILYTPLQSAASSGNIAAAELLLASGAEVNGAGPGNGVSTETPLSLAAERGNKGMIELLLAKGANVNAPDRNNDVNTPLHHAVQHGFKTAAEVLLAHKADVNARCQGQLTPLHIAASQGFNAVAELLLAHGADVNAASSSGYTPLHFAVRDNWPEMVKLLLAGKADVNFTNSLGETPLFAAQKNDRVEVARLLLEASADVNHRNKAGFTPLLVAARENQTDIVKLLLRDKADVNAALEIGITPLLIALNRPEVDINLVKSLLDNGADPQAHTKSDSVSWGNILPGMFALEEAIQWNRTDEMESLLAAHADANARFVSYRDGVVEYFHTPLLWVLQINRNPAEQFKILLAHGADPDLPDRDGKTPLSRVVSGGQMDLIKQLLDHHADPNKADDKGLPPLAYLPQRDEAAEIKALLLKAGANEDFQRVASIFVAQTGHRLAWPSGLSPGHQHSQSFFASGNPGPGRCD